MPKNLIKRSACLLAGILVVASSAIAAETPQAFGPVPGILLLRNSQVMEGQVEFSVDHYIVRMPDQEMQIRASEVEFFCRDLEDGYQHKKSVVQPNNIEEHLNLAQWCERHGLFVHAADELKAAEKIDVNHPMIKVLKRKFEVDAASKTATIPHPKPAAKLPDDEILDQMIRGMPKGAVQQYVGVVQPILLNLCPGAAGSTPGLSPTGHLQLLRPTYGEAPNRRITQRNLYAVLQFINWDDPGASSLLTGIIAPDGETKSVFLIRHSLQYRAVEQWVYQMAEKPLPGANDPAVAAETDIPSIQDMAQPRPRVKHSHVHTATGVARSGGEAEVEQDGEDAGDAALPNKAARPSTAPAQVKTVAPSTGGGQPAATVRPAPKFTAPGADPFDPDEFNKQGQGAGNAPQSDTLPTPAAKMLGNR
jgi:hypothetical protein